MGKKNKNVKTGAITLTEAGEEFQNRLVELYGAKVFVRQGKELAEMVFKNGFEGGAYVVSIPQLTERQAKISASNNAILKLNQMLYILGAMVKAELYTKEQTAKVKVYAVEIISALKEMLSNVSQPQRRITVKSPISVSPVDASTSIEMPLYEALPENIDKYDDGFDDVVTQ